MKQDDYGCVKLDDGREKGMDVLSHPPQRTNKTGKFSVLKVILHIILYKEQCVLKDKALNAVGFNEGNPTMSKYLLKVEGATFSWRASGR